MLPQENFLEAKILIVDDEPMSIKLLSKILTRAGYSNIFSTTDSLRAFELYCKIRPDLLILDLNMPHMDGFEIMGKLRSIPEESYLPIIVITSDDSHDVKYRALQNGAKDFLNKPFIQMEVLIRIRNIIEVRLMHNQAARENILLESKVKERTQRLFDSEIDFVKRLAHAVEYRDPETGIHVLRMSEYARLLAAKIGLKEDNCTLIKNASPLHDIGKIGIPDTILTKPGKLSSEEWEIMKRHTTIGAEILSQSSSLFIGLGQKIALTHHERWDGSGYPNGLKGEEIPLVGRICGLCDVFDALTSKRPYKEEWPIDKAVEEILRCKGTHFEPRLVDKFIEILPEIVSISKQYAENE